MYCVLIPFLRVSVRCYIEALRNAYVRDAACVCHVKHVLYSQYVSETPAATNNRRRTCNLYGPTCQRRASCSGRIEWADGLQPHLQLCTPQYDARCMLVRRYETGRRARAAGALRRRWGSTPQRCHGIGYRRLPRVHVRPSRRAPVGRSAAPRLHIQPPTSPPHPATYSRGRLAAGISNAWSGLACLRGASKYTYAACCCPLADWRCPWAGGFSCDSKSTTCASLPSGISS